VGWKSDWDGTGLESAVKRSATGVPKSESCKFLELSFQRAIRLSNIMDKTF
jgi:hypothetical protein